MRLFFHDIGTREARLLGFDLNNGGPNFTPEAPVPPSPEGPRPPQGPRPLDARSPEDLQASARMEATLKRGDAMFQKEQQEARLLAEQQQIVDVIMQGEKDPQRRAQLLQGARDDLIRQKNYTMTVSETGIVKIKPYVPPRQISPDVAARKGREYDLTYQIRQVDQEIQALGRDLGAMGRQEMGFRNAAYYRGNRAAGIRAQVLQGSMNQYGPDLARLQEKRRRLVNELNGVKSGRIPVRAGEPGTPTPARNDFDGVTTAPTTTFNLNDRLQTMDPGAAREVQQLPQQLQEPVVRMMDGMSDAERAEMGPLLQKMNSLPPEVQQALGRLVGPDGKIVIPKGADADPAMAQAVNFLNSLTPNERALYEKTVRVGRNFVENGAAFETESAATQQKINSYVKRWQKAKTEEDKQMAEGFLLLEGVDVDSSDLEKGEIIMIPKDERFFGVLMGFLKIILAFVGKLGGNKTKIEGQIKGAETPKDQAAAKDLSPEARAAELKNVEQKLEKAQESEGKLEQDIEKKEKKLKEADPDAQGVLRKEIAELKELLKELRNAIATLTARVAELKGKAEGKSEKKDDAKPDEKSPAEKKPDALPSFDAEGKGDQFKTSEQFTSLPFEQQINIVKTLVKYEGPEPDNAIVKKYKDAVNSLVEHITPLMNDLRPDNQESVVKTAKAIEAAIQKYGPEQDSSALLVELMESGGSLSAGDIGRFRKIRQRELIIGFFNGTMIKKQFEAGK